MHYVALRSIDIFQLQEALSILGLSNIEGVNSYSMASLTSVVQILQSLTQSPKTNSEWKFDNEVQSPGNQVSLISKPISDLQSSFPSANGVSEEISLFEMKNHARYNDELLFGPSVEGRNSRIMVTVGSEATDNEDLIYNLIKSGVDLTNTHGYELSREVRAQADLKFTYVVTCQIYGQQKKKRAA